MYGGRAGAAVADLAEPARRYGLRLADFLAIIDGMQMDVEEDIRAPDWAKLDLYCDRVASAVGRLSVRIFGMADKEGLELAHHLGRALQLTNILRDLDEDAAMGRLYLPAEALRAAGVAAGEPAAVLADPAPRCVPRGRQGRTRTLSRGRSGDGRASRRAACARRV